MDTDKGKDVTLSEGDSFNITDNYVENTGSENVTIDHYLEKSDGSNLSVYETDKTLTPGERTSPLPTNEVKFNVTNIDFPNDTATIESEFGVTDTFTLDSNNQSFRKVVGQGSSESGSSILQTD